jgi:hypothetical protein
MDTVTRRRVPDLLGDVLVNGTSLFRSEVRLARAEVGEKINQAMRGMIMALVGAVLMIPALVILLTAFAAALAERGMEPSIAAAIVGGGALVIGLILLFVGINRLTADNLAPRATIDQLRSDAVMAKEQVRT